MSKIDKSTHKLFKAIFKKGKEYGNKNRGVKRLQIPRYNITHKFKDGFPAVSNKELDFHAIVTELIWFLRGDNNIEFLNKHNVKIWNKDAYNWYVKDCEFKGITPILYEEFSKIGRGEVGQNYSRQWRNFNGQGIDQIKILIEGMKSDIMSSRLKVEAWNPAQINQTALPPCHTGFQIVGEPLEDGNFGFWLDWNQRSVDTFLGYAFNIASYGVLSKILESMTRYEKIGVNGSLKCVHFYDNQYDKAKEFLKRDYDKHQDCDIEIDYDFTGKGVECFQELEPHMFRLVNYTHDPAIRVAMLAPKKL